MITVAKSLDNLKIFINRRDYGARIDKSWNVES